MVSKEGNSRAVPSGLLCCMFSRLIRFELVPPSNYEILLCIDSTCSFAILVLYFCLELFYCPNELTLLVVLAVLTLQWTTEYLYWWFSIRFELEGALDLLFKLDCAGITYSSLGFGSRLALFGWAYMLSLRA